MIDDLKIKIAMYEVDECFYSIIEGQVYNGNTKSKSSKLKTLRNYNNEIKIVVDYGFKGNSRYANDKSDYFIADIINYKVYALRHNDYQLARKLLDGAFEEVKLNSLNNFLVDDIVVTSMTIYNMCNAGWVINEVEDGILFSNEDEKYTFNDAILFREWLLKKSLEF